MKTTVKAIFDELFARYPQLMPEKETIIAAYDRLSRAVAGNGTLFVCGNGGSAADSEHIVGELMKSFRKKRPIDSEVYRRLGAFGDGGIRLQHILEGTIRAVALTSHPALSTAFANDREPSAVFAQQLYGLASPGDILLAVSTSGNSENCCLAAITAKAMDLPVVALTGEKESRLSALADVTVRVPETETYKVQELHLPVYHCLCAMLEEDFF